MSTEAQPAAAQGPLSVDQLVAVLDAADAAPEEVEQEGEPEPTEESEADPTAEEAPEPEEAIEGEEGEEPESEPETPAIAAPTSWDAAERAMFATLPPEAQQIIAGREAERDKAVYAATKTAAEAKRAASQEVESIAALKTTLETLLPRAEQMARDKWANVDWVAWAKQDPGAATAGKFQYDAEMAELVRLRAANLETQRTSQRQYMALEAEKLAERAKTDKTAALLMDPKTAPKARQATAAYLVAQGADPQSLETLPAMAVVIAHKAHLYDQLQAGIKTPIPLKTAPTARAAVKPTAAAAVRTPQRQVEQLANRFAQTNSLDDAIGLLNARSARKAS